MTRRERKKKEQQRRTRRRSKSAPEPRVQPNETRERYLVENVPKMKALLEQAMEANEGRMPAIVVLIGREAQEGVMAVIQNMATFMAHPYARRCPEQLKREIMLRDYEGEDCVVLVDAGGAIMRTSFRQAELRYEMRRYDARFAPINMNELWEQGGR